MDEELFSRTRITKYKCVMCHSVACNICMNAISEDHKCYDEESKKVGVCENCQSCSSVPERPSEPPSKVQATLFSMLSKSNKRFSATSAKNTKFPKTSKNKLIATDTTASTEKGQSKRKHLIITQLDYFSCELYIFH